MDFEEDVGAGGVTPPGRGGGDDAAENFAASRGGGGPERVAVGERSAGNHEAGAERPALGHAAVQREVGGGRGLCGGPDPAGAYSTWSFLR